MNLWIFGDHFVDTVGKVSCDGTFDRHVVDIWDSDVGDLWLKDEGDIVMEYWD